MLQLTPGLPFLQWFGPSTAVFTVVKPAPLTANAGAARTHAAIASAPSSAAFRISTSVVRPTPRRRPHPRAADPALPAARSGPLFVLGGRTSIAPRGGRNN